MTSSDWNAANESSVYEFRSGPKYILLVSSLPNRMQFNDKFKSNQTSYVKTFIIQVRDSVVPACECGPFASERSFFLTHSPVFFIYFLSSH